MAEDNTLAYVSIGFAAVAVIVALLARQDSRRSATAASEAVADNRKFDARARMREVTALAAEICACMAEIEDQSIGLEAGIRSEAQMAGQFGGSIQQRRTTALQKSLDRAREHASRAKPFVDDTGQPFVRQIEDVDGVINMLIFSLHQLKAIRAQFSVELNEVQLSLSKAYAGLRQA